MKRSSQRFHCILALFTLTPIVVQSAFLPSVKIGGKQIKAFQPASRTTTKHAILGRSTWLSLSSQQQQQQQQQQRQQHQQQQNDIVSMRVSEIRAELKDLNIDYSDCFDKESLVARLQDARDGKVLPKKDQSTTPRTKAEDDSVRSAQATSTTPTMSADEEATLLEEIRSMRVRELKEELASRQIRWGSLLEKEDLVQAVFRARKDAANFSVTGAITPGQVADLNGEQLQAELQSVAKTPLLLDVYATWCGPCKIMAGELKAAATEDFRDNVRVAKIDSDKHSQMAASLRVNGLPTIILFGPDGKELDRIEGALRKSQLVDWVNSKLAETK